MTAATPLPRTDPRPRSGPLTERIGFEVELLAPPGRSRADLADLVAERSGGLVRRFFHTDSEPSLVPGMDHFIHLTQGFAVEDADGRPLARLEELLAPARQLGFTVPAEAAVHLHVDAEPLRDVHTFANLVRLFSAWRGRLREALGTNPRCRRLAPLPTAVVELVRDGVPHRWPDLCAAVSGLGLTKFADVNLTALVAPRAVKDTVEIRCLPGSIDADAVLARAELVESLLQRCRDPRPLPSPAPGARVQDLLAW